MRLADDDILVSIGAETYTLRPKLRAAVRLERRYNGYAALLDAVLAGNLTAIIDLLVETSTKPTSAEHIQTALIGLPIKATMFDLVTAAQSMIARLVGQDSEQTAQAKTTADDGSWISYRKQYLELYRIATGNLGWPPEQAWNATPAEILEAYRGRADLLCSIFGGTPPQDNTPHNIPDLTSKLDRAGLDKLRGRGRLR